MALCNHCGTELPEGASYCPKCGGPVKSGTYMPTDLREMKHAAKYAFRAEKRAFKNARRAERWGFHASPEWGLLNAILWGGAFILFGVLLYVAASGVSPLLTWSNIWAYLLLLIGVLLVLRGAASIVISRGFFRMGSIIGGIFLMAISIAWLSVMAAGWSQYLWVVIIILGGLLIILAGISSYVFRTMIRHN